MRVGRAFQLHRILDGARQACGVSPLDHDATRALYGGDQSECRQLRIDKDTTAIGGVSANPFDQRGRLLDACERLQVGAGLIAKLAFIDEEFRLAIRGN
ncbi:hypothetical protein D3C73_863800 [compost metagenome]